MLLNKILNYCPRQWLALLTTACCSSLLFLNLSSIPVALPSIQHELSFSEEQVEWVINVYFLALTMLILPAGRLADLFGCRYLLCTGFLLFSIGSLMAGFSNNMWWLFGGRILQGMGGASMYPAMGAYLISSFPPGERGKASGINVATGSIFLVLGPIIGGICAQWLSWRYLFFINLPLSCLGYLMTLRFAQAVQSEKKSFDFLGSCFLGVGIGSVTFALMRGAQLGWTHPLTLILFLAGFVFILAFFFAYRFLPHPIIDLSFFSRRIFTVSTFCGCLAQVISMVIVFWILYFQNALGYSPTAVGWLIVLSYIQGIIISPFGGYLADSFGVKMPVTIGFILFIFSLLWLAFFANPDNIYSLFPTFVAYGLSLALIMSATYAAPIEEIQENKRATALSLTLALRQLSPTFGIAFLSAIYLSYVAAEKPLHLAFKSINLLGAGLALIGVMVALIFLPNSVPKNNN